MELTEVDPEVAAAAFAADLESLWAGGLPERRGWKRRQLDDLTEIVELPARLADGTIDPYHLRLDARHYGPHPPALKFVDPETHEVARSGNRWFPLLEGVPPWFGLHDSYDYEDGSKQQLICFSFNLDFYISNHGPQPDEIWVQGRHTVAASLSRVHEVLGAEHYRGPSNAQAEAA